MKDFLGNTVEVGDYIFSSTTGRWPESRVMKILRFTETGIPVGEAVKSNRSHSFKKTPCMVRNTFVKVNWKDEPKDSG